MPRQLEPHEDLACFVISVAARLLGVHPQTLRYYERAGLVTPSRSKGNIRLYSTRDIERAQQVKRLIEDLGVNLAGVDVILRLTERIREMERELDELRARGRTAGTRGRRSEGSEGRPEIREVRAIIADARPRTSE